MRRRTSYLALVTIGALLGSQAHADEKETPADVRCLVVSMRLMAAKDDVMRGAAERAMMYYLGRLDGREPSLDLESRVSAELTKMKPEDYQAEALRCGNALTAKGATLTAIGKKLPQQGQQQNPQDGQKPR